MTDTTEASRVRDLNDSFRSNLVLGTVLFTPGVSSLPKTCLTVLVQLARTFDKLTPDNDPYGEHDFGVVELDGERYFFKIDYYDLSKTAASPDPANQAVTHRVLTVMRADEY